MKAFNVDDITLTPHQMTLYRKIDITSEKVISYRVTSPSKHCCQISIIVSERPGIFVIIHCFLFLGRHTKMFKSLKLVYSYACMLTSLYQFDKKLTEHFPANICLLKGRILTLR